MSQGLVQLSVRVSPELHDRVVASARRRRVTTQAYVQGALERALREPARGDDRPALATARRALGDALHSGAYRRYLDELDDPDLRDP